MPPRKELSIYFKCPCGSHWRYPQWMDINPTQKNEAKECLQCRQIRLKGQKK